MADTVGACNDPSTDPMRTVRLTGNYTAHVVYQYQHGHEPVTLFQVIVTDDAAMGKVVAEVSRHSHINPIDAYRYGDAGRYTIDLGLLPFADDGRGVPREREERRDVDPLTVALWALDAMGLPTR